MLFNKGRECGDIIMLDSSFVWTIRFFRYRYGVDLVSPIFSFGNNIDNRFNLTLSPEGSNRHVNGFTLLLQWLGSSCTERFTMRYKACFIDKYDTIFDTAEGEETFSPNSEQAYDFRWVKRIASKTMLSSIREDLVITFKMQRFPIVLGPVTTVTLEQTDFSAMLENPIYSDIILVVGEKQFSAHRCILASRSCVFRSMLKSLRSNAHGCLVIQGTTPDIFEIFLKAMYGYVNEAFEDNAERVAVLANKYNCFDIKHGCEKVLVKKIDDTSALRILQLADECHLEPLKTQALQYIEENNKAVLLYAQKHVNSQEWNKFVDTYQCETSRRRRFAKKIFKFSCMRGCKAFRVWLKKLGRRILCFY